MLLKSNQPGQPYVTAKANKFKSIEDITLEISPNHQTVRYLYLQHCTINCRLCKTFMY